MMPTRAWLVALASLGSAGSVVHAQPAAEPAAPSRASEPVSADKPTDKSKPAPWRVGPKLGAPAWLTLGIEQRSRYERLQHDFRTDAASHHRGLALRTLISAEATRGSVHGGVELEDARMYASAGAPLDTTHVDALELLRAYAGIATTDLFRPGDQLEVHAGRITIDLASRRLVARNRYRNTLNGFTGADATWTHPRGDVARAFVAMPVSRKPSQAAAVADNEIELDDENTDAVLWAAYYGSPRIVTGTELELYTVGLFERDGAVATRNRRLVTFGARWSKKPAPGAVDFEIEVLPQVGKSRAQTAATDTTDLDHRAWCTHGEVGISPTMPWKPRLVLQHDYASGDRDRTDGKNQRFDPLFGARRFDFGPTGLYGAFARANIQTPGIRAVVAPYKILKVMASYRLFWLASSTDAWTTAGVRDAAGDSGRFLGEQGEAQATWTLVPDNLKLELGAAYLRRGEFARTAPGAPTKNPFYFYTQLSLVL